MSTEQQIIRTKDPAPCIILIGMPGAGKTTIGTALAKSLDWPYLDTDHLIEAAYGHRLQDVVDATTKESFCDLEATVIQSIRGHRLIIGTGGSVIYRSQAMEHLKSLGFIVYLEVPLKILEARVAAFPDRGIAMDAQESLADLYAERIPLYERWSNLSCNNSAMSVEDCVQWICEHLPKSYLSKKANIIN
ncbi:MAG: shikimate kinase [Desulfovibrionaceae bacterium]|nr:shikimate kinase [Desulfovibrionaceae bacterium]